MNFEFFENLSPAEAEEFKTRFLELGAAALPGLVEDARREGINADLSLWSIAPTFEWLAGRTTTLAMDPDPSLPEWIRNSETYQQHLFEFDEPSMILILRAAYYLGESFVRTHESLAWSVGRADVAEQGQPVVTGFAHADLAVLLVSENLFALLVTDGPDTAGVSRAVRTWEATLPDL